MADSRRSGYAAVQRLGSAIALNKHFHASIPDGVFDLARRTRPLPALGASRTGD